MPELLPFPVLDAHVHFWDRDRLDYPWLASVPSIARSHLPPEYWEEASTIPVGQIIFVEAGCATSVALDENDWVMSLADQDSRIAGIVAQVPIDSGAETTKMLEILGKRPVVRGVRHIIQGATDPEFCLRPSFVEGVRQLADFDFTFDLCVHHSQLSSVIRLVDQCPDVRFVLDHVGKPDVRGGILEPWKTQLRELAARPHVWCKLSGLMTEANCGSWHIQDFQPFLAEANNAFGPNRIIYGSDWPVCRMAGSLEDWVSILLAALKDSAALEAVFVRNAQRCYRLKGSPSE